VADPFPAHPPGASGDPQTPASEAMNVQTSWLKSFLAVAESGGFSAATTPLHLSQSRVSAHIAALEQALGVELFDRKARPTRATEAGEVFRNHALSAMSELQRGIDAARSSADTLVAHATIGSYPSVSSAYLSTVLQELQARHPDVSVELYEGSAASLEELVMNGIVDLAFQPVRPWMRDSALSHRTIWREDMVAVMRDDDELAARATIRPDDLLRRPLIASLGDAVDGAELVRLTDQPATLLALVRSGFGVGIINRSGLETMSTQHLAIRTVVSPTAHRNIAVFWQRSRSDRAVVRALLEAQAAAALPAGVLAAS
jgi:LysR family carnitine catabolism transcriptional activator